jgi:hypothetical protein
MAQSNAERQRRYRKRLKSLAENGDKAVRKLNETYNAAAAEQRDEAMARIRARIAQSKDADFIRVMQDMIDRLPPPSYEWTLEDWCRIAEMLGKADEEETVREAEKAALRRLQKITPPETPRRPWSPFRHVVVPQNKTQILSGKLYRPTWQTMCEEDQPEPEPSQAPSPELA